MGIIFLIYSFGKLKHFIVMVWIWMARYYENSLHHLSQTMQAVCL